MTRRATDSAISRRGFLGAAALFGFSNVPGVLLRAAEEAASRGESEGDSLVVLQLTGGNDGLNTIIPFEDDIYHRSRPTLATRPGSELRLSRAERGDPSLAFHPSLEGLRTLWDDAALAVVPGVGYPDPDRSHFRSMDIWHTARRDPEGVQSGWLGRVLSSARERPRPIGAVSIGGDRLPLALAGDVPVPAVQNVDFLDFLTTRRGRDVRRMMRVLNERERDGGPEHLRRLALETVDRLESLVEVQSRRIPVEYPDTGLAARLRLAGQMIAGGFPSRIFYVSQGGYDTHATQRDLHASLLRELGDALSAFWQHVKAEGAEDRTTVLVFSEFGRRLKENASLGTDHGAAAPVLVAGGRVKGGVHGAYPRLDDLDDGDLRFHTDFRSIYAALLRGVLGVDAAPILGGDFTPLQVV